MCVRRGDLAGEDGGCPCKAGGVRGGLDALFFVCEDVFAVGRRVEVETDGRLCHVGALCGFVVSVDRKASRAAAPSLMVRMFVGPWGEGANCTRHIVSGGGRSAALGLPLERFATVASSSRGVGTRSSRLVIDVMTKPCD